MNVFTQPGPKADIGTRSSNVRFTPESGHSQRGLRCPLSAKSGHSAFKETKGDPRVAFPGGQSPHSNPLPRHAVPIEDVQSAILAQERPAATRVAGSAAAYASDCICRSELGGGFCYLALRRLRYSDTPAVKRSFSRGGFLERRIMFGKPLVAFEHVVPVHDRQAADLDPPA
jgi:hypothetical protein